MIFVLRRVLSHKHGFFGRKYSGKINGKKIVIEYFPPRMIQRALLNVFLETRIENGFVISIKRPLLGEVTKRSGPCQEISRIAGYYNIYSKNCKKAFKIISYPDIKKAIEPILSSNDHGNSLKQIYFEDHRIWSRERFFHAIYFSARGSYKKSTDISRRVGIPVDFFYLRSIERSYIFFKTWINK